MTRVTYLEQDGTAHTVDLKPGISVMKGAVRNNIPGIVGTCDGSCACGTCHVYVDDAWSAKIPRPSLAEEILLQSIEETRSTSHLSCQIVVNDRLEGLVVHIPATP